MNDMLEAGVPAVEVMTEYVRACRQLGHTVPEPARLQAAYTAEDGLDLQALDDDHRTLCATVTAVQDALLLQEQARHALVAAWRGTGAEAAADHLARHAEAACTAVDGLRATAATLAELRNRLWQLIDAKSGTAQDIESRGMRTEWLSASRTVTTGAGDRAAASELVDTQVAPFVANDIALDWVSAMRDTESAVRQAYRDATAAITAQVSAAFERAGLSAPIPVAAEPFSAPTPAAPASVVPAGVGTGPAAADASPAQIPVGPAAAPMAPPAPPPAALDPMAAAAPAAPMPSAASPFGSGMSGLSGLGQSFADMLGGLLGSGGNGLGESLGMTGDLDTLTDDVAEDAEPDEQDPADENDDVDENGEVEQNDDEHPEGEDAEEDPGDDEGEAELPATAAAADESAGESPPEPVAVEPEPPVPTPLPEPPPDPAVTPVEPAPADTPCEIAADELPQAGP